MAVTERSSGSGCWGGSGGWGGGGGRGAGQVGRPRDVRRADPVAVGDRGQALDVGAEQPGKDLGLGLAELGELLGHVGDGAVVLAQLLPRCGCRGAGRGGVAVGRQRLGKGFGPATGRGAGDPVAVAALELGDPLPGERGDRLAAAPLLDEAQRAGGEVVVGLVELVATGGCEHEQAGRTAPAADRGGAWRALLDQAVGQQGVQVAPHGRRGEAQGRGEAGGGGGAGLEDGARDPVAGRVLQRVFHNTSVALFGTDRKRPGHRAAVASLTYEVTAAAPPGHTGMVSEIHTRPEIAAGLRDLGVAPGDLLLVHTSVKALGWIPGGAVAVVQALRDAVGADGTIVVPTQTAGNSDPSAWQHPPVPE